VLDQVGKLIPSNRLIMPTQLQLNDAWDNAIKLFIHK